MNPQLEKGSARYWAWAAWALFAALLIVVLFTFRDYGVTWDEDEAFKYGKAILAYYVSGFTDATALEMPELKLYGGGFELLTAIASSFLPGGPFEIRHLLSALGGIVGGIGLYRLGTSLGGARAGLIAAVLLFAVPDYFGLMFNDSKDVPFAAAVIWAVFYLCRLLQEPAARPADAAKLGLAIGCALSVRVGGLLLLCYFGLVLALRIARALSGRHGFGREIGRSAALGATGLVVAYLVMLVCWPWAQQAPLTRPLQAMASFAHHGFPWTILFDGERVPAEDLPASYLPLYFAIKMPELLLALLVAGLGILIAARPSPALLAQDRRLQAIGFVGFAALFPLVYATAIGATMFNGIRHFLFVVPPLCCLGALALDWALRRRRPVRLAAGAAAAACLAVHAGELERLHPYEYVYYNSLVGGLAGAAGKFETDYWAASYREAVDALVDTLERREPQDWAQRVWRVAVCGPPHAATYYFPKNFVYEKERSRADFFISFTKDDCDRSIGGVELYRVERDGVTLSRVIEVGRSLTVSGRP